ncbi:sugar ABC transporter ATP-binding protein [Pleomorphomonas sp. JP5]|uniref:sugar ABC transporter ATP-binding protein n=1 Tax=Pleomorphomonas sp. JP5 TaxID=2942998 RepID=UPI00204387F2|nr:sugar ABC transporter ATP-binding protein [Pleomorphomonas sp. JP5]MCM5558173.1 sugar ABC transporter ATP-binding protein [Pleomorphomonas sp. JP5]
MRTSENIGTHVAPAGVRPAIGFVGENHIMELLRLEGLSKRYIGTQALDAVDMTIEAGQVLCLAGANGSGKSTLIKCVAGGETPDSGKIIWQGQAYDSLTPSQSMALGIEIIYQDLSIFPDLTVAENIAFHVVQSRHRSWVDLREVDRIATKALHELGADLPLHARLGDLPIGARQTAAIARALTQDCRLLVMDEPTTALPSRDVAQLLSMVHRLKSKGMAIVFISHKLDELFEIADRFYVLRDGRKVGDYAPAELTTTRLSYLMTGVEFKGEKTQQEFEQIATPLLVVEDLRRRDQYHDVSFSLRPGEIIGFAGLTGSGRTELALTLFGLNPADAGKITLAGRPHSPRSPREAITNGIALVSEDRHGQGLFARKAIMTNIASSVFERSAGRFGLLSQASERTIGDTWIDKVRVKTPSGEEPVQSLSGGNQQKVVLAKWLATDPKILILDNPTVGIDVGSKMEIHDIVRQLARQGRGVIMISDDLEELVMSCNRVFLMQTGTLAAEFHGETLTVENLSSGLRQTS